MRLNQFIKESLADIYLASDKIRTTEDQLQIEFDICVAPFGDGIHVLEDGHTIQNPSKIKFKVVIK